MTETEKKEKNYSTSSPAREWDYIVIGSGMGGMTSAALLSKLDKKVLLLEQHYVPGGFTHSFKRKKWEWDVGVHAIGEVTQKSFPGRLLSELTDNKLQWNSLGNIYDEFYFPDGFRIDFPDTPQKFRENLVKAFPQEEDAIDKYFLKVREVSKKMSKYFVKKLVPLPILSVSEKLFGYEPDNFYEKTTKEVLDELTNNENLKTVLVGQWGYYGDTPSISSFAIHSIVVRHFLYGAYYPVGGAKKIAECLLSTIAKGGGWTRIQATVKEIIIDNNKAVGVLLSDGEEIRANKVISAIGAQLTVQNLLPSSYHNEEWVTSINSLKPSAAHLCLNIGFKGDITKAGASKSNKFFWPSWNSEAESWNFEDPDSTPPILYASFPSLKDPEHDPGEEQLHTGELVTFVSYTDFMKWQNTRLMKRGEDYEKLKKDLSEYMLNQLFKYLPDLKPMVEFYELATPLSTEHFTKAVSGSIYGLNHSPERFRNPWLRPRTPINNFYFSGVDVLSCGVMGAMTGGLIAAVAAEPVKTARYLKNIPKPLQD